MDYLAIIKKKEEEELKHIFEEAKEVMCERVQGEISELSELSQDVVDGIECYPVNDRIAHARGQNEKNEKSPRSDVAIEPAAVNAAPIYWERVTGIVGPAQLEFLAWVRTGPMAGYWVVAQCEGQPVLINSIQLRSKRQFEVQACPVPMLTITPAPPVKPKPDAVEQSSLEFPDGR